MTFKEIAFRMI